jgi:hypothetical protein
MAELYAYTRLSGEAVRFPITDSTKGVLFSFFLRLIDYSNEEPERALANEESVTPYHILEAEMPAYDDREMEWIRRIGLGANMEDPLTTANLGKVFVN